MNVYDLEFEIRDLVAVVNHEMKAPSFLGDLGIFSVNTEHETENMEFVHYKDGGNRIIPMSPLGAPPSSLSEDQMRETVLKAKRFAAEDVARHAEVRSMRRMAGGGESGIGRLNGVYNKKFSKALRSAESTLEHMRLGALEGKFIDHDGSAVYDYYEAFGYAKPDEIVLDVTTSTTETQMNDQLEDIADAISDETGAYWEQSDGVVALCGQTFWRRLVGLKFVQDYLKYAGLVDEGLVGLRRLQKFAIGAVTFVRYRKPPNKKIGVNDDEVRFIPANSDQLFREDYGPSEFSIHDGMDEKFYPIVMEDSRGSYRKFEIYCYPLISCTNPKVLRTGRLAS